MLFRSVLMVSALAALCSAQTPPPPTEALEAMKKLQWWAGEWRGYGSVQMGPQRHTLTIEETIKPMLDGLILVELKITGDKKLE